MSSPESGRENQADGKTKMVARLWRARAGNASGWLHRGVALPLFKFGAARRQKDSRKPRACNTTGPGPNMRFLPPRTRLRASGRRSALRVSRERGAPDPVARASRPSRWRSRATPASDHDSRAGVGARRQADSSRDWAALARGGWMIGASCRAIRVSGSARGSARGAKQLPRATWQRSRAQGQDSCTAPRRRGLGTRNVLTSQPNGH